MIASLAAYAATMVSWNRNNKLIESCIVLDKVELIFIALYIRKEIKKKNKKLWRNRRADRKENKCHSFVVFLVLPPYKHGWKAIKRQEKKKKQC